MTFTRHLITGCNLIIVKIIVSVESIFCKRHKIRGVSVSSLITDKRLGTTKPSILSINNRLVEARWRNLILAGLFI